MKLSSSDPATGQPMVTGNGTVQAAAVRTVHFDRPLTDLPSWADPRLARQLSEAVATAREQGLAQGYAAGWAQGRQAAAAAQAAEEAERAAREEAALRRAAVAAKGLFEALAATARAVQAEAVPAWDELTDVLIEGGLRIAAAALARELAVVDDEVIEAARTALRLLPAEEAIRLYVHPEDAASLGADRLTGITGPEAPTGLTVVADASVPRGTVRARTSLHTLPVDLRARLTAAEEAIRP